MLRSRRAPVLTGVISLIVTCSLTVASAPSFASGDRGGSVGSVGATTHAPVLVAHSAATTSPTCKTLPTAQVARILGTSIATPVAGWPSQPLNAMGKPVLIGGKPLTVRWLACNYSHNPKDPTQIGVDVSYLVEPTTVMASTIVKAMCNVMRSVSTGYQAPKFGNGACLQGHTGPMQSSNGILVVKNVVVTTFGGTSPSQTSALLGVIARLLANVRFSTTTTMPGQMNSKGPVVKVTSTQFQLGTGMIPVRLSCSRAKCSGVVQLTAANSSGTVVLAQGKYNMPPSTTTTFTIALTTAGRNFFAAATDNPIQATVTVTLGGGKTVSASITVYTGGTSPPTTAVSTTTVAVPTTVAGG